jgi:hypothetical protein
LDASVGTSRRVEKKMSWGLVKKQKSNSNIKKLKLKASKLNIPESSSPSLKRLFTFKPSPSASPIYTGENSKESSNKRITSRPSKKKMSGLRP